ncbi:hypothetical protein SAMN05444392_10464 [Seinonella peptonophila]|uniref:Lipoprotein n=1 Tax=Seinonella peptonophila TaxID=112248 RepID=A0A1M4X0J0_9BACL|nr:hypothetical protein [Seinonella peptonophila]SHE87031.1 hypothetical protein SAMN05444392_10464 [Seinonella peptonophila]
MFRFSSVIFCLLLFQFILSGCSIDVAPKNDSKPIEKNNQSTALNDSSSNDQLESQPKTESKTENKPQVTTKDHEKQHNKNTQETSSVSTSKTKTKIDVKITKRYEDGLDLKATLIPSSKAKGVWTTEYCKKRDVYKDKEGVLDFGYGYSDLAENCNSSNLFVEFDGKVAGKTIKVQTNYNLSSEKIQSHPVER